MSERAPADGNPCFLLSAGGFPFLTLKPKPRLAQLTGRPRVSVQHRGAPLLFSRDPWRAPPTPIQTPFPGLLKEPL